MELTKKEGLKVQVSLEKGAWDYVERLALAVSGIFLNKEKHLTPAELDFFCRLVFLNQNQMSFFSQDALNFYNEGGIKVKNKIVVSSYLQRLEKKGWLTRVDSDYQLSKLFIDLKKVNINVQLINTENEYQINRQDSRPADADGSI